MFNQVITVVHLNEHFMVDLSLLQNSSSRFRALLETIMNENIDEKSIFLKITHENFSTRNIKNFLRICQNLPADVQNSEIIEICEIAAMFQAEKIFEKSINFIHDHIDQNFSISFDKYNDDQYLKINAIKSIQIHQFKNIDELEFDECYESTQTEDNNNSILISNENIISHRHQSVLYQIKVDKPFLKCRRITFFSGEKTFFSAKQKIHQIFIGDGDEIHINDKQKEKRAIITQNSDGYNMVEVDGQSIKIIYCITNPKQLKKAYSLYLSFIHCNSIVHWRPKKLKNPEKLNGLYNRQPILSKKNIILQNKANHTAFIVRKMDKLVYEVECHSSISPIIAFSVAISQIVGPFITR